MDKNRTSTWSRGKLLKFSLFSVLLFLLLTEGVFRVFFYFKFRGLHTSVYVQGSPIQADDTATVYNNRPYYVDYERKWQYNERGMKSMCGDFKMPVRGQNDLWVLLLGGSAMEGMGSNKDGAWFDITNVPDHPYRENIAFYLQGMLQQRYPGQQVRVFNAAVSGYTISQGLLKYLSLSSAFNFDWVISLDGVNECDTLRGSSMDEEDDYNKKYWASLPFHNFPLNAIVALTRHSASLGMGKQELYYMKLKERMNRNERGGFPMRKFWREHAAGPLATGPGASGAAGGDLVADSRADSSCAAFIRAMFRMEDRLKKDGKKYLLLAQPYLAFRVPAALTPEEQALGNYLRLAGNDRYKNAFFRKVYDTIDVISKNDLHIQRMGAVDSWPGWTFVDYCHLTAAANERIARGLADFIGADGKMAIFTK